MPFFKSISLQRRKRALTQQNPIFGWGDGSVGQLDDNILTYAPYIIDSSTWVTGSAGLSHSMAIKSNGTLWSWGGNASGQLGDNTSVTKSSPVQIGTATDWFDLGVGQVHSLAIKTNGTLWAWGLGTSGQLGDNTATTKSSPVQIGTDTDWLKVSGGVSHTMAIKTNNTLWSWGANATGEMGIEAFTPTWTVDYATNWSKISAGTSHTMAIKTDGTLWGWGLNADGNLGDGTTTNRSSPVQIGTLTNWSKISTGNQSTRAFSVSIKTDGTLWAWGNNGSGQLGRNNTTSTSSPVQIGTLTDWDIVNAGNLTLGGSVVARRSNGTLWAWGYQDATFPYLGINATTTRSSPTQIGTLTDWATVSYRSAHCMAIKTNGTLWGWGFNNAGHIGDNTVVTKSSPVQIGTLTDWSTVYAGPAWSHAIKTTGTLWGWGNNSTGGVGDGTVVNRSSPVQIGTRTGWSYVTYSSSTTYGVRTDGTLWAWGSDGVGNLGTGQLINRSSPVQVGTLTNWTSEIQGGLTSAGGNNHIMAIKSDGTIRGWGLNATGELGRGFAGSLITRSSPVQIGEDTWSDIAAGNSYSMAIRSDNTLWSWGANTTGQLGQNNTTPRSHPFQVGLLTNWSKVSSVNAHTLSVKTDGTLWGWGTNTDGRVGDNSVTTRSSPVQIGALTTWTYASAAGINSYAIRNNGTLWGWGNNTVGQIGNATIISRSSPVQIGNRTDWNVVYGAQSTAAAHVIGITTGGSLATWGVFGSGQLGYAVQRSSPVQIGTLTDWSTFSINGGLANHVIAVRNFPDVFNKTLWGWGANGNGQLGDGTSGIFRSSPVQIGTLTDWGSSLISTSIGHTIIYKGLSGAIFGIGRNNLGQLGDRSTTDRSSPVQIGAQTDWAHISAGGDSDTTMFSAGIRGIFTPPSNNLYMWGYNGLGVLGQRNTTNRSSPVQVGALTDWGDVSCGGNHVVAYRTNGTLWSWGGNAAGQVGDTTVINRSSPVQIGTLTTWAPGERFSAGISYTMAIRTDGTLWGWGLNSSGQLGDGTVVNKSSPVQVGTLTNWSKILAGNAFTLAIKTDMTIWGWGINTAGQLGNSTVTSYSSPIQIGTGKGSDPFLLLIGSGASHSMFLDDYLG